MLRHTVQFHWQNPAPGYADFEAFLASLSHDKRKKIRQERRKVADAGVSFRWSRGADISRADWDFFYRCYARTYREHGNPPYLTRDFFHRMADTLPEAWLLFVAEREGEPIAASLIALATDDGTGRPLVAYGRYWGAVERVDCLHFEACYYQPLAWCIAHGVQRFEGGAQGEHKMARRPDAREDHQRPLARASGLRRRGRALPRARGRRHRELHGPPGRAQPVQGRLKATAGPRQVTAKHGCYKPRQIANNKGKKSCHSSAWVCTS